MGPKSIVAAATSLLAFSATSAMAAPTGTAVPGLGAAADAVARGADGTMWVSQPGGLGRVSRISPTLEVTELVGGVTSNFNPWVAPHDVITTPDGDAWVLTDGLVDEWARIDHVTRRVTRYLLPYGEPTSMAVGSDGKIWMTVSNDLPVVGGDWIVRYDPATNGATFFGAGLSGTSEPRSIIAGADGALWFVESGNLGRLGRITTSGAATYRSVGAVPDALGNGPGGALWFARGTSLGLLGSGSPNLLPTTTTPTAVAEGPDGALWATGQGGLLRVPSGGTAEYYGAGIPANVHATGLASGADGRLWVSLDGSPYLTRVTVPPRLDGLTAAASGATSGAVDATVNPNGLSTTATLEVRSSLGAWTSAGEFVAGAGTAAKSVHFEPSGLPPASVVDVRITATNAAGVQVLTGQLTTPALPLTATPTPTPTATATPTRTPEPSETPKPTHTPEPSETPRPTATPTATETPTPEPTPTATPTPEPTVTPTPTPEPTATPDPTPTPEPTPEPTPIPVVVFTDDIPVPGTVVPTPLPTATPTPSAKPEPTATPSPVATPSPTAAPVLAPSVTPAPTATPIPPPAAPPVQGETMVVKPDYGTVRYRVPGSTEFRDASSAVSLPTGTIVDATQGGIVLASQVGGKVQQGTFSGGEFRVRQVKRTGMTQIVLTGELDCGTSATRATRLAAKKKRRHVWGKDNGGKYETHGRDSVAAVRGTKWLVTDTCAGTVVRVFEGAVAVRPKRGKGKTVLVRAGGRHFTRARR